MRVLLDTNVFISYLLSSESNSTITQIIEAAVLGKYTLLVADQLLDELRLKVGQKPYLARRITQEQLEGLISVLLQVAETVPRITRIPAVTRDLKDDYLIAYALLGHADYLATGDKDLLVLVQVDLCLIVTPRQLFLILIDQQLGLTSN